MSEFPEQKERKKENEQGQNILSQETFFLTRNLLSLRPNLFSEESYTALAF